MPICIECRYPIQQLYTSYSRADDRSSGKGVRLTQCPQCKHFADKYVEHDYVVLFIDLVLIKPQVYRHLLFNRLERDNDEFHPAIKRLAVLLLLFDVYLTWTRIERDMDDENAQGTSGHCTSATSIHTYPLPLQYLFYLTLCAVETCAFHLSIRLITSLWASTAGASKAYGIVPPAATGIDPPPLGSGSTKDASGGEPKTSEHSVSGSKSTQVRYPHPNRVSTALLVSSCSKLFPVLMVIWEYDLPSSARALSWAVIINNVAALEILLDCGYPAAGVLVGVGACCRWLAGWTVLAAAGLDKCKSVDVLSLLWRFLASAENGTTLKKLMMQLGSEIGKTIGFA